MTQGPRPRTSRLRSIAGGVLTLVLAATVLARQGPAVDSRDRNFDEVLEVHVRDGFVYYRALKAERGRLDAYVTSLANVPVETGSKAQQIAFWLNAYNAVVIQTVLDHYPITQRTRDYPARSIRQIPGAFERLQHRLGGKSVTLDQIEQSVLTAFEDSRVFLALGRGAAGSGRLRSEAYSADGLERQLAEIASECVNRAQCFQLDPIQNRMLITSIFSWRRNEFINSYAPLTPPEFKTRSPIEQAVLAFVGPKLLKAERDLVSNNTFTVEYLPFDWSLNDLTGRGR